MPLLGDALSRADDRARRFLELQGEYSTNTPPAPKQGVRLFSRFRARRLPAFVGPSGQDTHLQPGIFCNTVSRMIAVNNTTAPLTEGIGVTLLNNSGATGTAVALASTNFFSGMRRFRVSSQALSGTAGEWRTNSAEWFLSATPNAGGFFFVYRFGLATAAAACRGFFGLNATTGALTATSQPSLFVNMIGFGFDTGDSNLQFMCNDGSGTAPKVDLGSNFPINGATGAAATYFYEVRLFSPSGGGQQVFYSVQRLNDGLIAQGATTVDLPANGTLLAAHGHYSNGANAFTTSLDSQGLYIETDN